MKSSRTSRTLGLAALVAITSPLAIAEDAGWYGGGSVGRAWAEIDDRRITRELQAAGFATTSISKDERDTAFKLFSGYRFSKYFALEGGYFDLGEFGFVSTTVPAGTLSGATRIRGLNVDAVAFLPFTEKLSAFGRGGLNHAETKTSFADTGLVTVLDPVSNKRASHYKFGVGLQYDFTQALAMRVEAERYRINDAIGNEGDIDFASLNLTYRFGDSGPTWMADAAPDSPPDMAPLVVVVPAPERIEKYCGILDFQFEINQDEIHREVKEKLGVVGTFLKKYPDTTAAIEGHTDNVGTSQQNMELSKRRAEAVVAYLGQTFDVASSRLTATGYGETRPLADNSTEEGKRLNRRIGAVVACATDIEGLTVRPARMTMAMMMEFDRNEASIKPEYRNELYKLANYLKANPTFTATVEGHTGNLQATPELAQQISQRRAQNVMNYLVDNFDINRARLNAQGFGQTRRFAYNTSREGQQENRRVNVIINYPN